LIPLESINISIEITSVKILPLMEECILACLYIR
jgi:hypothetical protein